MVPADSLLGDSSLLTVASRGQRTGQLWGLLVLFTRLHLQGLIVSQRPHLPAPSLEGPVGLWGMRASSTAQHSRAAHPLRRSSPAARLCLVRVGRRLRTVAIPGLGRLVGVTSRRLPPASTEAVAEGWLPRIFTFTHRQALDQIVTMCGHCSSKNMEGSFQASWAACE